MHRDASGLLPGPHIDHQYFVASDCWNKSIIACDRPTFQVGHLVHRQFLHALAVIRQNTAHAGVRLPQIEKRHAVLAEKPGNVVAPIRSNQRVVGVAADIAMAGDVGTIGVRHIDNPDFIGVPQRENETLPWGVDQADHLGTLLVVTVGSRNIRDQAQGLGVEHLDATGFVIGNRHQASIL